MTGTDHVEFYWFPHTDVTLLKCNTRVPLEEGLAPLPRWRAVWDDEILANGAFAGVVAAGRRVPALIPPLARMSAKALGARTWTDHSHRVFVSRRRVRFLEMEYAIPRAEAPAVLAELRRVHEANDWRAAFPVEVRVAAADDIPLSTASGRDSAYIAAHVPAGTDPGPWFSALEAIAGEVGGRPHWGKLHGLDAAVLRTRYPRFGEFVALRDRLDPTGVLANAYLDRVLGPVGCGGGVPSRGRRRSRATSRPFRSAAPGRCGSPSSGWGCGRRSSRRCSCSSRCSWPTSTRRTRSATSGSSTAWPAWPR